MNKKLTDNTNKQSGLAVLETGAIMLTLLTLLLSGWAAIDLFQRGLALNDLLEASYYDGVVSGYQALDDGQAFVINHQEISRFLELKTSQLSENLQAKGISSSHYSVEGVVAEVLWREGLAPEILKISRSSRHGGLKVPDTNSSNYDPEKLAEAYLANLMRQGVSRDSLLRPDIWKGTGTEETYLTDTFPLVGVSAALAVDNGLARILLESIGLEALITRSSFNSLRRDL